MSSKHFVGAFLVAGLTFSATGARAAEKEDVHIVNLRAVVVQPVPPITVAPHAKRPAVLPLLYATLAATQAWDVYSTRAALAAGAREANPASAPFATNTGAMIGLKAATTAGTILFAERMWKKNKVAAIVMLGAINGATAAISVHNMRNAKVGRRAGI